MKASLSTLKDKKDWLKIDKSYSKVLLQCLRKLK
jgi:hypothetical protein